MNSVTGGGDGYTRAKTGDGRDIGDSESRGIRVVMVELMVMVLVEHDDIHSDCDVYSRVNTDGVVGVLMRARWWCCGEKVVLVGMASLELMLAMTVLAR